MLKMVSSQSTLRQSGRKREDLWWEGFVKEVGFEPGVEELWIMRMMNLWKDHVRSNGGLCMVYKSVAYA